VFYHTKLAHITCVTYTSTHCLVTVTANEHYHRMLFTNSTATLIQSVINKKELLQFNTH